MRDTHTNWNMSMLSFWMIIPLRSKIQSPGEMPIVAKA